jgi:hypothetical protein
MTRRSITTATDTVLLRVVMAAVEGAFFTSVYCLSPLFVDLDGFFAVSYCHEQKSTAGYWNRIPLCRRPSPREFAARFKLDSGGKNKHTGK